jgi:hypothetical protein
MVLVGATMFACSDAGGTAAGSGDSTEAGGAGAGGRATTGPGSGGAGGGAAGGSAYAAPHPPMPQAVTQHGPVMTAPKIVAITFDGDTLQADIDTFVGQVVAATDYWSGATAEYAVGPLATEVPVHVADAPDPTMTDGDVQTWLAGEIASGDVPQPDANTIYSIFYTASTSVTMQGGSLCQAFQGYHGDFTLSSGQEVTYAVMGRCPPPVQGISDLDNLAAVASHEFIEAATDPEAFHHPAYSDVDDDHIAFAIVGGGGEIGDLCAAFPGVFADTDGIASLVQRVWSNEAAAASHDPCQPGGASPYFNSAPDQDDAFTVGGVATQGTLIAVGQSKTIALHLYSDAPTSGPWTVSVFDAGAFFGEPTALDFALDKTQGQNGDTIELTITAVAASPLEGTPFWIESDLGGVSAVWIGLVANP